MFDTHAHLADRVFDKDRDRVIDRAFDAGVEAIVNVGTDLGTSRQSVALAEQYDQIYAAVGYHPHDAKAIDSQAWDQLVALTGHEKVVAVGETGLDFYRDLSPRPSQIEAFRGHIRLAKQRALPLIVHDRNAHREVLAILKEEQADTVGGVLHCFPGDVKMAREASRINFCLGFGGSITFDNSSALAVAESVPLCWVVLETDCPYLAPVPKRGKRNEPALLVHVLDRLSREHSSSREEIRRATTRNAYRLFKLNPSPTS